MFRRWLPMVVVMAACAKPVTHDAVLDFQDVNVGESRVMAVTLSNASSLKAPVLVSNDEQFAVSRSVINVSADGTANVNIKFTPRALGPIETELRIISGGTESTMTLRGRGIGARVDTAEDVALGRLRVMRAQPTPNFPVPIRVRNSGTSASSLSFTVSTDDDELCVNSDCTTWSATLAAGEVAEVPVTVKPTREGTNTWKLRVDSDDPLAAEQLITVRATVVYFVPCVLQAPTSIDIPVGQSARLEFTHVGLEQCLVESMTLTSAPDVVRFDVPPEFPMELETGRTKTLVLETVQPRPLAGAYGTLSIVSPGAATIDIPITVAPTTCLAVAPNEMDFGAVRNGCSSASRTFQIYNTCSQALTLGTPRLIGDGFELVRTFTGPLALQPGGNASVEARFVPIRNGAVSGAIAFEVNGSDYVIALSARGDVGGENVDTYSQPTLPKIDLLMMVDTSPSFAPRRAEVRANVERVLQRPSCTDLRVAFAPADGADDAGVRFALNDGGLEWTSNRETDFTNRALGAFDTLGTGSEVEACIGPAAALMQNVTPRDGGALSGLCITDALEQTPNPTAALAAFGGGRAPSHVSWNVAAAKATSTCAVEGLNDPVHRSLVQSTNGRLVDICASDWAAELSAGIGMFECGYRTVFYLTSRPMQMSSIVLRIDGQVVATGWTYDAAMNAVNFAPHAAPQPGTTLTITYDQGCTP